MANILVLAESGSGKTTSLCPIPELEIKGLNPDETYIISATAKPLPFKGSQSVYKIADGIQNLSKGRRFISNNGDEIAQIIVTLSAPNSPIKNIVIDDSNYIMQDYYMANAAKGGWETPKKIGAFMNNVFTAMEVAAKNGKNVIMLAHPETYQSDNGGGLTYRMKTVGKMVSEYITPEGKFDIVLYVKVIIDPKTKKATHEFVTNRDDQYPAKSPVGMFDSQYIPNDLGLVIEKVKEYYG